VRGLISLGVRQGEHVGVLMSNRPSALAVVAALNRLGAVAVLLRPDGDLAREAELGQVTRIVADPERAEAAKELGEVHTFVLGGGAEERDLGPGVTDMERIDPDTVELPAWYRPNPGRASDVAFILFAGEGENSKVNRITNRRWALGAFGTASSAALPRSDTVYTVTPLYHPSGLLMTIGGALAGDARIAMTTAFDPATFWDEVRRYGVTIASYTWTGLHDLVEAPLNPAERHHPIRLFIGSGMSRGLWRRVEARFAPARVLEFWASTEGDAILVNLSGAKPGAMGRPLPGSAEVRIAAWDADHDRLVEGRDGLAVECGPGEVGMLLARSRPGPTLSTAMVRGVFAREDAWLVTGDLFERDSDGDYWLVSNVNALIRTAEALVPPLPIRDALEDLPAVDLAVAYGVPGKTPGTEIAVAAVTLREGRELVPADIAEVLSVLDAADRPLVVHVVDEIPLTTWHRPITGPLRKAGVPPAESKRAWYLDRAKDAYRPLTAAARKRLAGEG
jgi:putative long chain acyl-CoA synthase